MFNPCCCWNLKDGCVTIGIWSIVYCISQMGIFGWQTAAIKFYKDRAANALLPAYAGSYDTYDQRFPGYYERFYESPEEKFYTFLFIIQILNLIAAFFLLFAAVALIYGVHTNSRHLVWPWFPCMASCIVLSMGYCITWLVGDLTGYWLVLVILQALTIIINLYCLLAVIVQYRRIVSGIADTKEPYYGGGGRANNSRVYFDNSTTGYGQTKAEPVVNNWPVYQPQQQTQYTNAGYTPDFDYKQTTLSPPQRDPLQQMEYLTKEPVSMQQQMVPQHDEPPLPIKHQISDGQIGTLEHEHKHPIELNIHQQQHGSSPNMQQQQWIEGVMLSPDAEPANTTFDEQQLTQTQPPSPTTKKNPPDRLKHAQSASVLDDKHHRRSKSSRRYRDKDEDSRSHRRRHRSRDSEYSHRNHQNNHHRSSSRKSSRGGGRGGGRGSGDESDSDNDGRRSKHRGHSHSHSRSRSRDGKAAGGGYSDSDTGYSRSEASIKHRRRHRDDASERSQRHRRPRDVKKDDKNRRDGREAPEPPRSSTANTSTELPPKYTPAPPTYPGGNPGGGISIPQHIVIPPTAKGKNGQPQRFHINSEITISYSDRSTPNPSSDSELKQLAGNAAAAAAAAINSSGAAPNSLHNLQQNNSNSSNQSRGNRRGHPQSTPKIEPLTSPGEEEDENQDNNNPRNSFGSNHGSTAV